MNKLTRIWDSLHPALQGAFMVTFIVFITVPIIKLLYMWVEFCFTWSIK